MTMFRCYGNHAPARRLAAALAPGQEPAQTHINTGLMRLKLNIISRFNQTELMETAGEEVMSRLETRYRDESETDWMAETE